MSGHAVRIGISGWSYAPWRGVFYPPRLRQRDELQFASRAFSSIEINGSFYSLMLSASSSAGSVSHSGKNGVASRGGLRLAKVPCGCMPRAADRPDGHETCVAFSIMSMPFSDRREAGRYLAEELVRFAPLSPIVLALPRGGVPVAYEVARRLRASLDVFLVRKLGAPHHPELAIGAIASGGATVLNHETLLFLHVSERELQSELLKQRSELERRVLLYRENAAALELRDEHLIVVDDGFATGASMLVAVQALRQSGPRSIVVAAPVAASEACDTLAAVADEVVCLEMPPRFRAVGLWYRDFEQVSDREVVELLASARRARSFTVQSSAASSQ